MMKKIAVLFFALSLVGCEAGDRENKRALATLVGLGAGGAAGYFVGASGAILPQYLGGDGFTNQLLWSAVLGSTGALGGYYLAENLLPTDREKLDSTAFNALNNAATGQEINWGEKGKGAWGTFKPVRNFTGKDGSSCRAYVATINIDGKSGIIEEAACRLRDGGWQTVST
mgnify:FL=1